MGRGLMHLRPCLLHLDAGPGHTDAQTRTPAASLFFVGTSARCPTRQTHHLRANNDIPAEKPNKKKRAVSVSCSPEPTCQTLPVVTPVASPLSDITPRIRRGSFA